MCLETVPGHSAREREALASAQPAGPLGPLPAPAAPPLQAAVHVTWPPGHGVTVQRLSHAPAAGQDTKNRL